MRQKKKNESIVTNVIEAVGKRSVIDLMQKNKFAIMIDESTDTSTIKHMTVFARIEDNNLLVRDEFVTLIEVQKATADALYDLIIIFLNMHCAPIKIRVSR